MRNRYPIPAAFYGLFISLLLCLPGRGLAQAAGPRHHLVACASSELWAWGDNTTGQLGQDPAQVPDWPRPQPLTGLANIVTTAVSQESSYALSGNGLLWSWGGNSRGELGTGTALSPVTTPAQVPGLTLVNGVAAGDFHAVAIDKMGSVWAWGANDQGQLGNGNTIDQPQPVPVLDGRTGKQLTDIQQLCSAANHTLALSYSGQLYSWGSNAAGELGTNSANRFETMAWPVLPGTHILLVATGAQHGLALSLAGTVYAWGDNTYGQLGDGTSTTRPTPVTVPLSGQYIGHLVCTRNTSLAASAIGRLYAWGDNTNGEFGKCDPASARTPLLVATSTTMQWASMTGEGTLVRLANGSGSLYTWGGPDYPGYVPAPGQTTPSGGVCVPTSVAVCAVTTQPLPCVRTGVSRPGATYVAARHLGAGAEPTDIGRYGQTTTIDASQLYGGQVIFDGQYRVRGSVRLINGTFELRPGTVFYVDGLSGQQAPADVRGAMPYLSYVRLQDATLILRGATMQAACDYGWGGIEVGQSSIIRTESDPATGARSLLRDAFLAVNCTGGASYQNGYTPANNSQYYLKNTDFLGNVNGVSDYYKQTAQAGEGVHYCRFSADVQTNIAPYSNVSLARGYPPLYNLSTGGIELGPYDQLGGRDYSAALIDHNQFDHLGSGIVGTALNLHIADNTFDHVYGTAISAYTVRASLPMFIERNTITLRGRNDYGVGYTTGIASNIFVGNNTISGDDANPAGNGVLQVGIDSEPSGNSQTGNTLQRLDWGIAADLTNAVYWNNLTGVISGNLLRDCYQGIRFHDGFSVAQNYKLAVRCNTFQNPARLPNAVGLMVEAQPGGFPNKLGDVNDPNGNRFGTNGVGEANFTPVKLGYGTNTFTYYAYGIYSQEVFATPSVGYTVVPRPGNPAYACDVFSNGIQQRSAVAALPDAGALRLLQDSLRQPELPFNRQRELLGQLTSYAWRQHDLGGLEQLLGTLPDPGSYRHAALANWLLYAYQESGQPQAAQRMQQQLLQHHATDAEVRSHALLWGLETRLRQIEQDFFARPTEADFRQLRELAGSRTGAAWPACRLLRRYEPACRCQLPAAANTAAVESPAAKNQPSAANLLGAPYPNPATESVQLPYELARAQPARLELRDALGRVVWQQPLPAAAIGAVQVPVRGLAAGLYVAALVIDTHTVAARRVAVQN